MISSFDDILINIGSGKFQYLMFFACSSWGIFGSMHLMLAAFIVPQSSDFECQIEELQSANWTQEEKRNFSIPWIENKGYSKCFQYQRNYSDFVSLTYNESLSATSEDPLIQRKCSHWIYDTKISNSTLISEWDLVCDRHYLRSFVQSVFMAGTLVASLLGGYLADKYGRVRLIFGGFILYLSCGILSGFSTTFELVLVSRFFVAVSGHFVYLTSYILMLEWCLPRQRSIFGLAFSVPFALGYMALPFVAFYVREWRLLLKGISGFTSILVFNLLVMVESPRWLIQNGKMNKAVKVVNYVCKMNGKAKFEQQYLMDAFSQIRRATNRNAPSVPKKSVSNICFWRDFWSSSLKPEEEFNEQKRRNRSVFISPKLFKSCVILTLNWFVCNLVYYGLSLSAGNFGVDPFLYMFLGGLMEIPCYTIIVPFVVKYGRRISLISFFGICGITVLSSLALSTDYTGWGFVVLNMFGKLNITSAFQLLYLYTSEIFPTNIRTRGVGITSMIGRLGSIVSPVVTDVIGSISWRLPVLSFGCCSVLAAVVTLLLPETYEKTLPDTAEDVEGWNQEETGRNVTEAKEEEGERKHIEEDQEEEKEEEEKEGRPFRMEER